MRHNLRARGQNCLRTRAHGRRQLMTRPWCLRRRRRSRRSPRRTLRWITWSITTVCGGVSGSLLASNMAGGWPLPMGPRVAIPYGGRRGSSTEGQGRAWYDSGYMAYVSSWSLCRIFLLFYAKENLDPEVVCLALWRFGLRVTLNEKFAQSILQLPSSFSHLYSSRRNARFNSGICYASGPGVWTVFLVEVDSYPEVDSRPALLGPCSVEKCAQFRFWLLQLEHLEICTLFPRASRIWQSLHTVQFCVRKVFSCVSHRRGTGVAGSRDSQVTR